MHHSFGSQHQIVPHDHTLNEAWAELIKHDYASRKFLVWSQVRAFTSVPRVRTLIEPWYYNDDSEQHADCVTSLALEISAKSPRLFTLLLLHANFPENGPKLAEVAEIIRWTTAGINDSILVCSESEEFEIVRTDYEQRISSDSSSLAVFREVLDQQWIIPPVFVQGRHHERPLQQRSGAPPFLSEEIQNVEGSYGKIYAVDLEPSHFEFSRDETLSDPSRTRCVGKRVRLQPEKREDILREVNVLNMITKLNNPYLVKLLASFEMLTPGRRGPLHELCMIFPRAVQDLSQWLRRPHEVFGFSGDDDTEQRQQVSYDAIWSITSGVAFLHGLQDDRASTIFHHDLKPKNVLVFVRESRPVWKLCDFGNSLPREPHERNKPSLVIGTYAYQEPEYDSHSQFSKKMHAAELDNFGLGCILLEICIVLIYGWDQNLIEQFRVERLENTLGCGFDELGHEDVSRDDSYHNNRVVLDQWLSDLSAGYVDNDRLKGVLGIVEGLLRNKHADRLLSWEALLCLFEVYKPQALGSAIRAHCEQHIQPPPENLGPGDSNPLHRALFSQRKERIQVLEQKGWRDLRDHAFRPTTDGATVDRNYRGRYFSTLPRGLDNIKMVGRKPYFDEINRLYSGKVCSIALWGRGGIGKTRIAYYYLTELGEFMQGGRLRMPRIYHRFWVVATDQSSLLRTYMTIADEVGIKIDSKVRSHHGHIIGHPLLKIVNTWLEKREHQPWIMVLDGLVGDQFGATSTIYHQSAMVQSVNQILPQLTRGQTYILVTTKNKADVESWTEKLIRIGDLEGDEGMDLFNDASGGTHVPEAERNRLCKLVGYLASPQLIQMIGKNFKRFNHVGLSLSELCNTIEEPGSRIEWLGRNFKQLKILPAQRIGSGTNEEESNSLYCMLAIIGPLIESLGKSGDDPEAKAAELLSTIATLSQSKIEKDLLQLKYARTNQHTELMETVTVLMEHSLLEGEFGTTMSIHELLQDTVLLWHLSTLEGHRKLMHKLDETLSMLWLYYREQSQAVQSLESWKQKLNLFPHINRLLVCFRCFGEHDQDVIARIKDLKIGFSLCAAKSALTFARELRMQARFEDAKLLLQIFVSSKLAKSTLRDKVRSTRVSLLRALSITCEESAFGRHANSKLEEARSWLKRARKHDPKNWRLMFDTVVLARRFKDVESAEKSLQILEHFLTKHEAELKLNGDLEKARVRILREFLRVKELSDPELIKDSRANCEYLRKMLFLLSLTCLEGGSHPDFLRLKTDLAIELSKSEESRPEALSLADECLSQLVEKQQKAKVGEAAGEEEQAPPDLASDELDMRVLVGKCQIAVVYRRLGEHEREKDLLQQAYQGHVRLRGIKHVQTRKIAYDLRMALLVCHQIPAVVTLQRQFVEGTEPLELIPWEQLEDAGITLTEDESASVGVQ